MDQQLLSGNEAIARGAWEAGAGFGVGYPGTPSTETLQYFGTLDDTYAEWAPNEKVALEVAIGLSMAGQRALVTMKHVGVNVAADPLFTVAYTGVNGGLVILAADDPGMHSSQNEQDSRMYAASARIPMLEPSDSDEARRFTEMAFGLSERFDVPFMIRSTVRISHAKSMVAVQDRAAYERKPYEKDPAKWVMMPGMAKVRRRDLDARIENLQAFAGEQTGESLDALNRVEMRDTKVGFVTSGVCYQYVREAFPEASILKLGMVYPLSPNAIRAFAHKVDTLYVVEEANPYLKNMIRSFGIEVADLTVPVYGELSPATLRQAFDQEQADSYPADTALPPRPPLLCPGCPHRVVFNELKRINALVTGDIGCYTLGSLPPLAAIDSCVDMGASISMAHGIDLAGGVEGRPSVAVIGDSTFAHSGITSLLNTVYNTGGGTVAILDNRTTAMTGHQGNPVNGLTLQGRHTRELELEPFVRALGVENVRTVDAQDFAAVRAALAEETADDNLSVIIFESPCALLIKERRAPYEVGFEKCRACGQCIKLGCPAISKDLETGKAIIDRTMCVGCGQCVQLCKFDSIVQA